MAQIALFKMLRRFNLTIDAGVERLRNLPMYNTYKIDLYKGIENRIELSVRNNDRKSVSLMVDSVVTFSLVSEDKTEKFDFPAVEKSAALGLYNIFIGKDELLKIDEGNYFGHIIVTQNGRDEPLYTTQDFYPFADVVVHENKFEAVLPTKAIAADNFVREINQDPEDGQFYETFTSGNLKADRVDTHTLICELSEFVGELYIDACPLATPDAESWVELDKRVYEEPVEDEEGNVPERFSGNILLNETVKTKWLRVRWKRKADDKAEVKEVQYRN